MKRRAFVVMPFGTKPVEIPAKDQTDKAKAAGHEIDFDAVYQDLLRPALLKADCDPFRADGETSAGDIRTDMFFELVTADLVVADVSIPDPNVFYELGVRHGVCPHGILVVQGDLVSLRFFDVAPDRSFTYDASLFVHPRLAEAANPEKQLSLEVERLSQTFKNALAGERETTGSPVYAHLPGLIPVNWDKIETSRAKYFGALSSDWLERVRIARTQRHPGDIKTLADDAPTRVHGTKILYQAALALIDLCLYAAAARELQKVIADDPNHFDAQLQLGRVLVHQGNADGAKEYLLNILQHHEHEPRAADLLGQVSRYLWHLSWRDEPPETRKEKAIATSQRAAEAVRNFIKAHRSDPGAYYYAGFNALILIALADHLSKATKGSLAENWPPNLNLQAVRKLTAVVEFCAKNSWGRAIEEGDSEVQFLTTTTLAGLALIQNQEQLALQRIRDACNIPGATFLQVQTFQERLCLIDELDFRPTFVKPALAIVDEALKQKNRHQIYGRVFLWAGYPVDAAGQKTPRFPESSIGAVQKQIAQALDDWHVAAGDLAICEGVQEGDILFAEACQRRNARVRLMVLAPLDGQLHQGLWPFQSDEWERRFNELRSAPGVEVWFHSEHLGAAFDENTPEGRQSLQRRHKNWLINTASLEAEPAQDPWSKEPPNFAGRLHGLFLFDGEGDGQNPEDPSYFIEPVRKFNDYQGQVKAIKPLPPEPAPQKQDAAKVG